MDELKEREETKLRTGKTTKITKEKQFHQQTHMKVSRKEIKW